MSTRGAVLLRLLRPAGTGTDALAHALVAIKAVESLLQDLDCGAIPPPKHVFRIIPFASTCRLGKESLEVCARQVSTIATTIIRQRKNGTPTFGIAVHNRDQQTSTRHVNSRATYNDGDCVALSRKDVIDAVATGLTRGLAEGHAHCHAIKELKGDLSDPTIVISVEMVPIMGRVYAGISLLPRSICSTKPKLAVKSLR